MASNIKNIGTATLRANEGLILSGSVNTEEGHTLVVTGTMKISGAIHDENNNYITANELIATKKSYIMTHVGTPASSGNILYVMSMYMPGMAQFVSTESGGAFSFWEDSTGAYNAAVAWQSNPPAMGGLQVYFDHDAEEHKKFLVDATSYGAPNLAIPTSSGRIINITHNADASTVGVPVYFDIQALSPRTRMIADLPDDTTTTTTTSINHAWLNKTIND
jgi:hypothetical protein